MRTFFSILLIATAMAVTAQEKKKETIEGNGKLVTRDVAVTSFSELKAAGVYELKLTQGASEWVKIEADENLQELFIVRNEGNKLVIEMKKDKNLSFKNKTKMKVYVSFKNLKALQLSTVGNVQSENQLSFTDIDLKTQSVGNVDLNFTANKLEMNNNSVGNVKLSGKAQQAVVKNSGVGALEAGAFVVQTMNIENTGVGSAEVNAEKDLKVKDSFLGKVKNKGGAKVRKLVRV